MVFEWSISKTKFTMALEDDGYMEFVCKQNAIERMDSLFRERLYPSNILSLTIIFLNKTQ